jgi:asparagine synthase (glutamine-hydrolysing)
MSGICGFIGAEDQSILKDMFNQMYPSADAFIPFSNKNVCFCGNSLNISKRVADNNIISNEDESIFLAFDGEIYNFLELKHELVASGHTFKSDCQHEVLLHLFEEMGRDSVSKLNGIFSAALWDENRKELFLFIDKLGIKQLFYTTCDNVFLFGSSIKSLAQYPKLKRELDEITLNHLLTLEFTPTDRTLMKGIFRIKPAHMLVYSQGKIKVSEYWDFPINVSNKNEDFYAKTLRRLLEESIGKRIVDSQSIGALLSGGMDSSAVVALLRNATDKPIKTFSVYLGEESSAVAPDWKYARLVAEHTGTNHYEMVLDDTILNGLPHYIWAAEEPSTSLVPLLMREFVKKHVDVVFTGRGSDELFGGQGRFAGIRYINLANKMHRYIPKTVPILFSEIMETPKNLLTKNKPEWNIFYRYFNILSSFGNKTFFYASIIPGYVRDDKHLLYSTALSSTRTENTKDLFFQYFSHEGDLFNEMARAETKTRLSAIMLNTDHKISNFIGLIERTPFVDPDIVEFSFTIPSHLKVRNNCTKYILRKAVSDILPKEVIQRKKGGGFMPKAYFLLIKTDLKQQILTTVSRWNLVKNGYIREDYIKNILSRPVSLKFNRQYSLILFLLSLEIWFNIFIAPKAVVKPDSDLLEKYLGAD